MKDKFFKAKFCERCGASLNNGRIMSMYNTQVICLDCKSKEEKRSDYEEARNAELNEVKSGNYNYGGIGYEEAGSKGI